METLGMALLALLAGAGGSAVLELVWKPRRIRRRVATLIHADVLTNAQLILAHSELRKSAPRRVPQDLVMSRLGFDTAGHAVAELDPGILRKVILYFNRVDAANRCVEMFADVSDRLDRAPAGTSERTKCENQLNAIIDAWNVGLDKMFETTEDIALHMESVARIRNPTGGGRLDIAAEARRWAEERDARLAGLSAMDGTRGEKTDKDK